MLIDFSLASVLVSNLRCDTKIIPDLFQGEEKQATSKYQAHVPLDRVIPFTLQFLVHDNFFPANLLDN